MRALVLLALAISALAACKPVPPSGWSGYVEGEYVYVAAPLAGALTTLDVERGRQVARGAPLFSLETDEERAARAEASARLDSARAQAADTSKGRRAEEIEMARAQLAQAKAQAALAADTYVRDRQLVERGFVSAARIDESRSALRQARARVSELEAALRVAELPARDDTRAAAEATAKAAQFALAQSRWREDQKHQSAPADALVADTFYRVGEWVAAGQPVVSLLPAANTLARFFVPEEEIGRIAPGQPVTIVCDGCAAPIAAKVTFVATRAEYTPPVIYSNSQRARLVFMVEARPAPADGPKLRPGQPVEVRRVDGPGS